MSTNIDMAHTATSDPVASPSLLDEKQLRYYKEEGYLLLPSLIPFEEAEALRAEVMEIMEIIGLGTSKLRQTHEYLPGSHIDRFVNSAHLLCYANALMDGPSSLYLPFTAVKSGGGGGEFHYHQDNQYTRFDKPGMNMWFALTPMTEQNGCLKVVPRSHLHGTLPSYSPEQDGHKAILFEPESFVPMLMQPGDCVAFSRLTVHGSGPNTTPEHRVGYAVQFNRRDGNYSLDGGATYKAFSDGPRWSVGPVERITVPEGKTDGH
ncbi:MAG TPA: phytanoyl-CoA dioxygenase family protein [Capsulimonadaceae bacterium]|nr:phytanoyl-CoA dioxygenase family protein [Capsulimonadaceae bacterium]